MTDLARLTQIIEPEAVALGFDLVRVKMMPSEAGDGAEALQIMAEDPATGQLIIDQCAALSRAVSARMEALEEAGEVLIEGAYHLEVSSPGIDRPLTRAKDFVAWAGHEAKISLAKKHDGADNDAQYKGQRNFKGVVIGIEEGVVTLDDAKAGRVSFPMDIIHSAKLLLTDALIAATQPLDSSGADDIVEDASIPEQEKADD
jgi:ribosome maturation factor RimP